MRSWRTSQGAAPTMRHAWASGNAHVCGGAKRGDPGVLPGLLGGFQGGLRLLDGRIVLAPFAKAPLARGLGRLQTLEARQHGVGPVSDRLLPLAVRMDAGHRFGGLGLDTEEVGPSPVVAYQRPRPCDPIGHHAASAGWFDGYLLAAARGASSGSWIAGDPGREAPEAKSDGR